MKRIAYLLMALLLLVTIIPDEAVAHITGTLYQAPTATPRPTATPKPTKTPKPAATNVPYEPEEEDNGDTFTITAVGAYIQEYENNRAKGKKYASVQVTKKDDIIITAESSKVSYWVINGVRYDFERPVKTIRLNSATQNFTFEAVEKKTTTKLSPSKIQSMRTGETLIVQSKEARLRFRKGTEKSYGGGSFQKFDFTNDYTNKATNAAEQGGQISLHVSADIPKGQHVVGWKFNNTKLIFNGIPKYFFVLTLNASMIYEPIFGNNPPTKKPTKTPTRKPTKTPVPMVKVTCINCTFTGGGYHHATSGKVPKGTTITVTSSLGSGNHWKINNSWVRTKKWYEDEEGKYSYWDYNESYQLTRTINYSTKFESVQVIN